MSFSLDRILTYMGNVDFPLRIEPNEPIFFSIPPEKLVEVYRLTNTEYQFRFVKIIFWDSDENEYRVRIPKLKEYLPFSGMESESEEVA